MALSNDGRTFFNVTSELFRKVSPEYPPKLIDRMLASMGFEPSTFSGCSIADIGSGAGQSARPLLERGFKVYCVDPSEKINEQLREVIANFSTEKYELKLGSALNTTLEQQSVDGIVVANALHWMTDGNGKISDDTLNEFRRILKPNGTIGILFCMQRAGAPIYNIINSVCSEVLGEMYTNHPHNLSEVLRHTNYAKQVIQSDAMIEHLDTYRRVAESEEAFKEWLSSYTFVVDAEPHQKGTILRRVVEELKENQLIAADGSVAMEWHTQAYCGRLKNPQIVADPTQNKDGIEARYQQLGLSNQTGETW